MEFLCTMQQCNTRSSQFNDIKIVITYLQSEIGRTRCGPKKPSPNFAFLLSQAINSMIFLLVLRDDAKRNFGNIHPPYRRLTTVNQKMGQSKHLTKFKNVHNKLLFPLNFSTCENLCNMTFTSQFLECTKYNLVFNYSLKYAIYRHFKF